MGVQELTNNLNEALIERFLILFSTTKTLFDECSKETQIKFKRRLREGKITNANVLIGFMLLGQFEDSQFLIEEFYSRLISTIFDEEITYKHKLINDDSILAVL